MHKNGSQWMKCQVEENLEKRRRAVKQNSTATTIPAVRADRRNLGVCAGGTGYTCIGKRSRRR